MYKGLALSAVFSFLRTPYGQGTPIPYHQRATDDRYFNRTADSKLPTLLSVRRNTITADSHDPRTIYVSVHVSAVSRHLPNSGNLVSLINI
mgnify:CR=1 FL=1